MESILAKRIKVETASHDDSGMLLFVNEKLVACLVLLSDDVHGQLRGQWCVEAAFGWEDKAMPSIFPDLTEAVAAITARVTGKRMALTMPVSNMFEPPSA